MRSLPAQVPGRRAITGVFCGVLLAVAGLGWLTAERAQDAILESRAGSVSEFTLDASAPGFRAFTDPTPVVLVAHTAIGNQGADLVGASVLTAADAGVGGTIVTIPSTFRSDPTEPTLKDIFASEGLDALIAQLQSLVGSGFSDVVVLDGAAWTTLMREDLPLTVSINAELYSEAADGTRDVFLSPGTRELDLFEVARVATHQNRDEPALGIALRHQRIWQSWIGRTASSEDRPDLFELDTGFSSVIGALASGEVSYRTLPTQTLAAANPTDTSYIAETDAIADLFARIVPFPIEVEAGDRASVLLLDSSLGAIDRQPFLEAITRNGGRVTILGNTDGSAVSQAEVQIHDPSFGTVADAIAEDLGLVAAVDVPLEDATTAITVLMADSS